jgi:heme/copper-type cytochrome/quinol oxidase subunit 3
MTDDDCVEKSYSGNSDDESYCEKEEVDRDEVKEVRKMSSKDTTRIRFWRYVVTVVLLLTAFAVTFATYTFLEQQEYENFVTAVCLEKRISSTVLIKS